jgi:threonine dehydratase
MAGAFASLVRETPLVPAPALGERVALKLESLQRGGSFKLRGACLKLDRLPEAQRARGVICASAGNHGLGLALAGRALGVRVEVVVPRSTPEVKTRAIAELGASLVVHGEGYDAAEAEAQRRAAASGQVFCSPFDDDDVIAGNGGTLAEELLRQCPEVRRVIASVGGGGLCAGLLQVLAPRGVEVIGAQPAANCAMHESLRLGRALTVYQGGATIAEGCEGAVAERTYAICRDLGLATVLVDEAAIRRAVAFAYRRLGVLAEPSAAVAIAAVDQLPRDAQGTTVVVVCGANLAPALLDDVLRQVT